MSPCAGLFRKPIGCARQQYKCGPDQYSHDAHSIPLKEKGLAESQFITFSDSVSHVAWGQTCRRRPQLGTCRIPFLAEAVYWLSLILAKGVVRELLRHSPCPQFYVCCGSSRAQTGELPRRDYSVAARRRSFRPIPTLWLAAFARFLLGYSRTHLQG